MSKMPKYWIKAKKNLSSKDRVMAALIKNINLLLKKFLQQEKIFFFLYAKVLLVNKLVLWLLIQFF